MSVWERLPYLRVGNPTLYKKGQSLKVGVIQFPWQWKEVLLFVFSTQSWWEWSNNSPQRTLAHVIMKSGEGRFSLPCSQKQRLQLSNQHSVDIESGCKQTAEMCFNSEEKGWSIVLLWADSLQNGRKIFAKKTSGNELMPGMYKGLQRLNTKT